MLLLPRPQNLDNKARYEEKTRIVLEWLVTFRITSLDILSSLLGHTSPKICSRFFDSLLKKDYIVRVKYPGIDRKNLVVLGNAGARFIDGPERPRTKDLTRIERILNKDHLTHDLQVQKFCLYHVSVVSEIIESRHCRIKGLKPDALLLYGKNELIAVEYERWKKSHSSILALFARYMERMSEGEVSCVLFSFANQTDMNIYKNAFDSSEWLYSTTRRTEEEDGTVTKRIRHKTLVIKRDDPRRKRFSFSCLPVDLKPHVVTLERNSREKYVPEFEYLDRIEKENQLRRERQLEEEALEAALEAQRTAEYNAKAAEEAAKREIIREQISIRRDVEHDYNSALMNLHYKDNDNKHKLFYRSKVKAFEANRKQWIENEIARRQAIADQKRLADVNP